jgi:hypothetical protein
VYYRNRNEKPKVLQGIKKGSYRTSRSLHALMFVFGDGCEDRPMPTRSKSIEKKGSKGNVKNRSEKNFAGLQAMRETAMH